MGKPLAEHLRFAVAYWHSLAMTGSDPFGGPTMNRPWMAAGDPIAQAKAKEEKAERRLEQANKDAAYVRGLYQDSSNAAQTSAAQVSELENDLGVAQNKATGEQARLRQMGYDTFTRNLQDENKKLKTMLNAEINENAAETLNWDTSRPFVKPTMGRIAVKVINHLGDEVMKVFRI